MIFGRHTQRAGLGWGKQDTEPKVQAAVREERTRPQALWSPHLLRLQALQISKK